MQEPNLNYSQRLRKSGKNHVISLMFSTFEVQKNNIFPMNKDTNNYPSTKAKILNLSCPTLFNLSGLGNKKVEVKITMEKTSNDGGLLLLREVENLLV